MITDKILTESKEVNEFLTELKDNGYDLTEYFIQIVPMHTSYGNYYFDVFYDTEYTNPKRK